MEPRWLEAIKNASLPPSGQMTERAIATVGARPIRRTRLLAALPVVAALPVLALFLPRQKSPVPVEPKLPALTRAAPSASPNRRSLAPAAPVPQPHALPSLSESFPPAKPEPAPLPPRPARVRMGQWPAAPRTTVALAPVAEQVAELTVLEQETVKQRVQVKQQVQIDALQDVMAAEASAVTALTRAASATTALSTLAEVKLLAENSEALLRYPLSPLPNAPQAAVLKAEILQHADAGFVYGNVTLIPENKPRELLVAVFDARGILRGTKRERIPAKAESVTIRAFMAPMGSCHYQLGLRPYQVRDKNKLEIIGGYVGHSAKVTVPAPDGVDISSADFYQSNVHKDYFARFHVTLSEVLLSRQGELSLKLHGIVFDEKGALLSVGSKPIASKPGQQRLDLDFGLLPKSREYGYKFVVTHLYEPREEDTHPAMAASAASTSSTLSPESERLVRTLSARASRELMGRSLDPLPDVPQAAVQKAELVRWDSGKVSGKVALAAEETPRDLLIAVFDTAGALLGTTSTLIPAKAEKVEVRPFDAPRTASHYQIALRPHPAPIEGLMVVGGYLLSGNAKAEVPAPPGVHIGDEANFYQSAYYKTHFVRFGLSLSKKLLTQPGLTLHGAVFDEKGALLSIANTPIANKTESQSLDLEFGLLPEGTPRRYRFIITRPDPDTRRL
jgi:hypothetical protein